MAAERPPDVEALRTLLAVVEGVVRRAALPVMERFRAQQDVWDKARGGAPAEAGRFVKNPVTEADLLADRILREGLPPTLPGSAWLSEETADTEERLGRDAVWIVDPIDGTREYMDGIPQFAISVALAWRGEPILGVLLNPASDDLFTAVRGAGAFRGGAAVHGGGARSLDGAVLLASRTEAGRGEFDAFRERFELRQIGSTALKLGLAAAGEGDAYFTRRPRHEWDVAAGVLIAREAGLAVTDLSGAEHRFNQPHPEVRGVLAAPPDLHAQLIGLIGETGTSLGGG
jgi:myo-inositol-1(or 4)-monophosphatase